MLFNPFFFLHLYCQLNSIPLEFDSGDHPAESNIHFDPFIQQMTEDDINRTALKNSSTKDHVQLQYKSQQLGKAFISSPMDPIPRNGWYRLFHIHSIQLAQSHPPANVEDE